MARPRTFEVDEAVDAAKDTFWARGYEGTSIGDLEACTGLNRSSLYQAFGSKRKLFDAALERYRVLHVTPVLAALEAPGAGLPELRGYFATLASALRGDPELAVRGCLIVNTMAELGARDPEARAAGLAYRDRVTAALANALRGAALAAAETGRAQGTDCERRARALTSAVMGALVSAHLDPEGAAQLCDELAADLQDELSA